EMMRARVLVLFVLVAVLCGPVFAATAAYEGRMCNWDPVAHACTSGFAQWAHPGHRYQVGRPNAVYVPPIGWPARNELVVYLHGCCAGTTEDPGAWGDLHDDGFITQAV